MGNISGQESLHSSFRDFLESGAEERHSPFLRASSRKISYWLTLPLSLLSALFLGFSWVLRGVPSLASVSSLLLVFVYFVSGTRSLKRALEDFLAREINIDVLMTLSAYICLFMGSAEEGGLLLVMFDISRNMEHLVNQKARKSLMSLREKAPEKAWVIEKAQNVPSSTLRHISDIAVESLIEVKAGEIVPLDGILESEKAFFSVAHLTGEAVPVPIERGQWVCSGSETLEKAVHIRVKKLAQESTITRILRLITEAQESKPKLQRTFDSLVNGYAKTILFLSGFFALSLFYFASMPFWGEQGALYRGLSFLIAASPCALILAIPIANLSALSACAKRGILLKSGALFDTLADCRAIAFDKTGTLTSAQPRVISTVSLGNPPEWFFAALLTLEKQTHHPLANAIVAFLQGKQASFEELELEEVKLISGEGISARVRGLDLRLGSLSFALALQKPSFLERATIEIEKMQASGLIVVAGALEGSLSLFGIEDSLRQEAVETVAQLRETMKIDIWMLTGDSEAPAKKTADFLGIEQFQARLKPEEKLAWIRAFAAKSSLMMVGDGVNDAPALAASTIGVAMAGVGSSAAIHAADVLLLDDNLQHIPWLLKKALKTRTIMIQNVALAGVAILLASSGAVLGMIPLWLAVVAHEGGTILVGINGLRLMRQKI